MFGLSGQFDLLDQCPMCRDFFCDGFECQIRSTHDRGGILCRFAVPLCRGETSQDWIQSTDELWLCAEAVALSC